MGDVAPDRGWSALQRVSGDDANAAMAFLIDISARDRARSDLRRDRVILRTEFADPFPMAGGDRSQLQQVITNLLRNAADAMSGVDDRPRQLVVRTEGSERLFDAFYTTKSDGMGIGLSVSRSIIDNHRGRLWADLNDGPGATFSFAIPKYAGDASPRHDIAAAHLVIGSGAQRAAGPS
jgi:signal transduction histidine kinase